MTISLRTSIKVNYPSLSFMSLPLSIRLTGLAFQGVIAVAYEGDRKRLHVSILDGNEKGTAAGQNLLRNVTVESEVGQSDKLVIKDMAKVEQFVVDVARKALEVSGYKRAFQAKAHVRSCINRTRSHGQTSSPSLGRKLSVDAHPI